MTNQFSDCGKLPIEKLPDDELTLREQFARMGITSNAEKERLRRRATYEREKQRRQPPSIKAPS
jgi:hypothetical protein